jgi:putative acetyltransferase
MIAVVAYPRLDVADTRAIEAIRTALDPQARRIAAHVTLVFPVDLTPAEVAERCAAVAASSRPIPFVIRKAMARREPDSAGGRVFYVPEEGAEGISALHRRLYDSPLKVHLWPEPPYVPHITLAVDPDWPRCEALAERLTIGARMMSGWIDTISLIEIRDPRVATIAEWAIGTSIAIVPFEDQYQDAFARLNKAWLTEHGLFEEADRAHLEQPRKSILAGGGQIFVAIDKGVVIGVCATIVQDADTIEFAKFAVSPEARGRGIGRQLTAAALAWARDRGARKVMLLSSRKLDAALRLYERSGFIYGPLPAHVPYSSADVYMEMTL